MQGLLKDRPMLKYQYAYRAGLSADNALHELIYRIEKAVFSNQFVVATFLDIDGAFNNAVFHKMVEALEDRGVDPGIGRWINFMLTHRSARATLHGVEVEIQVQRGCPQGGILSPILWNLIMDVALRHFDNDPTHAQSLADDLATLSISIDVSVAAQNAQRALNFLSEWARIMHLSFSVSKCVWMVFTHRRKWEIPTLTLSGSDLQLEKQTKFLGTILDSRLSWLPNIDYRLRKALITLACCKRIVGNSWGVSPKSIKWVYTQVVRPMITFGCVVWVTGVNTIRAQSHLCKFQRKALMCITSAFPGTPTAALEAFLDIPPLHLHVRGEALKTAHRLQDRKQWNGMQRHIGNPKSHVDA